MSEPTSAPNRTAPYGTWPSPVSAAVLAAGGIRLGGVACRGGERWWSELRPAEGARSVVVRAADGARSDALPAQLSARTRVHEYGGGAWWLGRRALYVANWADQRLYRLDVEDGADPAAAIAEPITPEPPEPAAWRYADGREHPVDGWVVCVVERHGQGAEAVNHLAAIDPDRPDDEPAEIGTDTAAGPRADFVAGPRFSPDGRWLSWFRWSHPDMPWDGTELCVASVEGPGRLGPIRVVAGAEEPEAIHGADWTAAGDLVFSSDRSGFWNLHRWSPGGPDGTDAEPITNLTGAEIGGPQWVFGIQRWVETTDGRLVVAVTTDGADHLAVVDPASSGTPTEIPTPYVEIESLAATDSGTVVVQAATPTSLVEIVELDLDGTVVATHRPPDDVGIDPSWFSTATPLRYASGSGDREAHAWIYRPTAPGLQAPAGERPPLVVMGHGGPTAHSSPALNLRAQYWTSRGFAVADVNYGGSTGFGAEYRRLLDDAWGIVDVEDCVEVARRLADDGTVDGARMAIRGGSAGGFTVLTALIVSDAFAAGTSLFGVADLEALAAETHKFESRYLDRLIGPYPERRDIYIERSPITHVDRLARPLLVLQGLEDEIVPPSQAEAIVAALAAKDVPHAYETYEGEQHGFRQAANIIRSYEVELWFYGRVFGFDPADVIAAPDRAVGL